MYLYVVHCINYSSYFILNVVRSTIINIYSNYSTSTSDIHRGIYLYVDLLYVAVYFNMLYRNMITFRGYAGICVLHCSAKHLDVSSNSRKL